MGKLSGWVLPPEFLFWNYPQEFVGNFQPCECPENSLRAARLADAIEEYEEMKRPPLVYEPNPYSLSEPSSLTYVEAGAMLFGGWGAARRGGAELLVFGAEELTGVPNPRDITGLLRRPRTHIGTPQAPGTPGGPINPEGLYDNCTYGVAAVLYNKLIGRGGRSFLNAHDVSRATGTSTKYENSIENSAMAIDQVFEPLGLRSTWIRQPSFSAITEPGHYALFGREHVIYGRVLDGKRILYDPQLGEVVTPDRARSLLKTSSPEIHQIVPQ